MPSYRPLVMGREWMVAAGHPLAASAGEQILRQGGNAVDAAIATAAVMAVVRPHMSGLGGEAFSLLWLEKEGRLLGLNASGPAPALATVEHFRAQGVDAIPVRGIQSAIVPGALAGWTALWERAGTMPWEALLAPAIDLAENGFPVSPVLAIEIGKAMALLRSQPEAAEVFFPNGRPPRTGNSLVQPGLARSLRLIAKEGRDAFYQGPIDRAIDQFCRANGGLIRVEDLASYQAQWVEPLRSSYRGFEVTTIPPNCQGLLLQMMLNMLEGDDLKALGKDPAALIHLQVESKILAFSERERWVGDPRFVEVPLERFLSKGYAKELRNQIDMERTHASGPRTASAYDTTAFSIVDGQGNVVSHIQSLFYNFGSGVMVGDTGIFLNNRLHDFSLRDGHPNRLEPGKRVVHTLTPVILFRDGTPCLAIGTPGGHNQVQSLLQVLVNWIDLGMNLQEAIEAPRWRHDGKLFIEERIPPEVVRAELERRGHRLRILRGFAPQVGGAQGIVIDRENRVFQGAADPRREGFAVGW